MYVFSAIITVVLAVAGAAAIVQTLIRLLFGYKKHKGIYVFALSGDSSDAEMQIRYAEQLVCSGKVGRAVCVDCGISGTALEICKTMCAGRGIVELVTAQKFSSEFIKVTERG